MEVLLDAFINSAVGGCKYQFHAPALYLWEKAPSTGTHQIGGSIDRSTSLNVVVDVKIFVRDENRTPTLMLKFSCSQSLKKNIPFCKKWRK